MSEIMNITDEKERQKSKDKKRQRSDKSYSEIVRAKWFCCALKLGFVQLICKASLIFQVDFRVSYINYFKRKRIIRVKACCGGV